MPLTAPTLLPASRFQRVALALCLFLFIWGVKLAVIDRYGSDLAFWDQWAKEGENLYPAWFDRRELWPKLVLPHNEHRIAPTLALDLGIVVAGGQWDSRVQCVVSAALHAAIAAGLLLWSLRQLPRGWALGGAALLAVVGASCIARDNVLTGFQSQFFFLIVFSLLAIGGLLTTPAFSLKWWAGGVAGALAIVSMGSGFLFTGVVAGVAIARLVSPGTRRDAASTLLAVIALGGLGLWLRTPAPWHESLHAHGAALLGYATRCLAWPLHAQPWFALIIWLPWLALVTRRLRSLREPYERRATCQNMGETPMPPQAHGRDARATWHGRPAHVPGRTGVPPVDDLCVKVGRGARATSEPQPPFDPAPDFVIAGGAWVLLQTAAVSYSRGGPGGLPAGRYGDVFALGLVFGFFALALLAPRFSPRRAATLGGLWLAVAITAVVLAARPVWREQLPKEKTDRLTYERNVHQFVLTDDYAAFEKQTLPFPLAEWLARILRNPTIRAILPASVRAPISIEGLADGVTLPIPSLVHRPTRAMLRSGEWRSSALPAGRGWWKIETAGHLGEPGALLQLVAVADGHTLDSIAPSKFAGNTWRAAYVRAPAEPARLVARSDDPERWFAFSEPVEMSTLSYDAWQLTRQGRWLALLGFAGGLVIVLRRRAHL